MPRYNLSIDETRNTLNQVIIDTSLNETELDALLSKIEENEVTNTFALVSKLESQGVKVEGVNLGSEFYYVEAKTLEIEQLEEPKKQGCIIQCKACELNQEIIEKAINELREKMYASIDENGRQSDATIQVSQDLDVLIVSHMKKQLERR